MGKLITGWWEELGLDIEYSVEDNGVLIDGGYNYDGDTYKPDYDMYIWAWQPSGSDPGRRLGYFRTVQIENQNDACWSNKEYDALWEQQSEELDPQKRKEIAYQMQEILYEESPYIILTYPKLLEAWNTEQLGGLAAHPAAQRRRRLHQRQRQQLLQGGAGDRGRRRRRPQRLQPHLDHRGRGGRGRGGRDRPDRPPAQAEGRGRLSGGPPQRSSAR